MTDRPEAAVIAAIDALERDDIDELVDWQMSDSPAAHTEGVGGGFAVSNPVRGADADGVLRYPPASDMFAITPDGERVDPDADGVLHCQPEDQVFMLGPGGAGGAAAALATRGGGGGGGRRIDAAMAAALAWRTIGVEPPQFPRYRSYGSGGSLDYDWWLWGPVSGPVNASGGVGNVT